MIMRARIIAREMKATARNVMEDDVVKSVVMIGSV